MHYMQEQSAPICLAMDTANLAKLAHFILHKESILYYNVIDEGFRILPNMVCVAYLSNYCLLC